MSPDVSIPDIVSLALVVESSVAVHAEWRRILVDYISQILRRLAETYSANNGHRLRIAFVTYGSADTLPTPLLSKRFFTDYLQVIKELKEHQAEMGLGETNSGGSKGMAALEGLTAAVELFDQLKVQSQSKDLSRPTIHHLLHISASPPDDAMHPRWNVASALDNLTWDTLPSELKKRNIHFSLLCLRLPTQRLTDLFAAASVSGPTNPWFQVNPSHSISLSGFTPSQPQKVIKRSGEPHAIERPQEAKRPRLTDISPKPPLAKESTNLHATPITLTQSLPTAIAQPHPPQSANNQPFTMNQLMQRLHNMREQLGQLEMTLKNAENEGNKEKAETLRLEYNRNQEIYAKLSQIVAAYNQQRQQADAHVQGQAPTTIARTQSSPVHMQKESIPKISSPSNDLAQISSTLQPPQVIHSRTISGSNIPQPIVTNTTPTSQPLPSGAAKIPVPVEAQMRGLLDQRRHLGGGMGISPPVPNVPHPEIVSTSSSTVRAGIASTLPLKPPFQTTEPVTGNGSAKPSSVMVWQGTFTWSGTGPSGKKEIRANLFASSNSPECRADTWPDNFTLVPTQTPIVELSDLREWMKRHKPALCTFYPDTTQGEGEMNNSYYRMLVQLLTQRRIYATAAWTRPSGAQENNVLIMAMNAGLIGAFFPLTGIPEMPKPSNPTAPLPLTQLTGLPPQLVAQLQPLNNEQRMQYLAQYVQQKQMQARQAEQVQNNSSQSQVNPLMMMSQGINSATQPNSAHSQPIYGNMGGMSGHVGMQVGSNGNNAMSLGPGHANNIASVQSRSIGGGNMNYDLQSFMQRNGDSTM
ncbi:hypothetical protein BDQ17DRAFT_1359462 [Cyathus striatus]|nr:hypothetical protein BDQ17DRAFT_1359462 [Cyathus striatus]